MCMAMWRHQFRNALGSNRPHAEEPHEVRRLEACGRAPSRRPQLALRPPQGEGGLSASHRHTLCYTDSMPLPDPSPLLARAPVIPVLTIGRVEDAVPLARALVEGGLPILEVTLRTPAACDAIAAIAREVPDACVGAGTVLSAEDLARALQAGAKFIVSPGTPATLADALAACGVPALPGCATVSEAMTLSERGFTVLKFFPAEASGGVRWLKSVADPLPKLKFCPTGGITLQNAPDYLALPNIVAVGGSWVAPKDALAAGDFARIAALAREAARLRARA